MGNTDIALAMSMAGGDDQSTKPQSRSVNAGSKATAGPAGKVRKTNNAGDIKEEASRVSVAGRTQRNRSKAAVAVSANFTGSSLRVVRY